MIAAWMLYALAVTAFLGLGALAVEKSLRLARQPGRWILATAIVGAVFVPVVTRSESAAANADVAGFSATAPTASLAPLTAVFPDSADLQSLDVPLIALWIGVTLVRKTWRRHSSALTLHPLGGEVPNDEHLSLSLTLRVPF